MEANPASSSGNNMEMTRLAGGIITVASVGMGLALMFIVPISCTIVGSIGLMAAMLLFAAGLIIFLVGHIRVWRKRRQTQE